MSRLHVANEKNRVELPERKKPLLHVQDFIAFIFGFVFLIPFFLAAVIGSIFFLIYALDNVIMFIAMIIWDGLIFSLTYQLTKSFFQGLWRRNKFLKKQSRTTATILRRWVLDRRDVYNPHYTYFIQVSFLPTIAVTKNATKQYQIEISGSLYNSLLNKKTVGITYAIENPSIFLLDGEHIPGWERT